MSPSSSLRRTCHQTTAQTNRVELLEVVVLSSRAAQSCESRMTSTRQNSIGKLQFQSTHRRSSHLDDQLIRTNLRHPTNLLRAVQELIETAILHLPLVLAHLAPQ